MEGWIKLHRSKIKWEWFTDYKTSHLFEYLLLCASHNEYRWKGKTFIAGQLPFGLSKASDETGLTIQMIRTSLKRLKSTGEITIKTSTQGSVITIEKWDEYQVPTDKLTNKQQTSNKQVTTTNNDKNEKNDNKYDFDLIYAEYPRKAGKKKGMDKLQSIVKTQELYDKILQGSIDYKKYCDSENKEAQYIKHFDTWVNQECWNDEYLTQEDVETDGIRKLQDDVEELMNRGF